MKLCVSHVASGFHEVGQTVYCKLSLAKTSQTFGLDLGVPVWREKVWQPLWCWDSCLLTARA